MSISIREERSGDAAAIESVTVAAFRHAAHRSGTEHDIVNALRRDDALSVSLVAESDGTVVGHVAVSPVAVSDGSQHWFGLGPISVLPACQGQGIGSALVIEGLKRLRGLDAKGCVLAGNPAYYGRFGFSVDPDFVYPGIPPEYFMRLAFSPVYAGGTVAYHPAFYG